MTEQQFDVFLCHNSIDKPIVVEIAQQLQKNGIKPWLDIWEIQPGAVWQVVLEKNIERVNTAAVFVGEGGIGPWQEEEVHALLQEFKQHRRPIIPVLLHNAPSKPKLPIFLRNRQWIEFQAENPNLIELLIWGITGQKTKKLISTQVSKAAYVQENRSPPAILQELNSRDSSIAKDRIKRFVFQYTEISLKKPILFSLHQKPEIFSRRKQAEYFVSELGGGIELEMVHIPQIEPLINNSEFTSSDNLLFMSKYPISQAQWKAVSCLPKYERYIMPSPSKFKGFNRPVENVSWLDTWEFCKRLSLKFDMNYRLPAIEEWQYACRAGTSTK